MLAIFSTLSLNLKNYSEIFSFTKEKTEFLKVFDRLCFEIDITTRREIQIVDEVVGKNKRKLRQISEV